jgi:hypothetical protein
MAFSFKLLAIDGRPADPPSIQSIVGTWRRGDTIPLGPRTVRVSRFASTSLCSLLKTWPLGAARRASRALTLLRGQRVGRPFLASIPGGGTGSQSRTDPGARSRRTEYLAPFARGSRYDRSARTPTDVTSVTNATRLFAASLAASAALLLSALKQPSHRRLVDQRPGLVERLDEELLQPRVTAASTIGRRPAGTYKVPFAQS